MGYYTQLDEFIGCKIIDFLVSDTGGGDDTDKEAVDIILIIETPTGQKQIDMYVNKNDHIYMVIDDTPVHQD